MNAYPTLNPSGFVPESAGTALEGLRFGKKNDGLNILLYCEIMLTFSKPPINVIPTLTVKQRTRHVFYQDISSKKQYVKHANM